MIPCMSSTARHCRAVQAVPSCSQLTFKRATPRDLPKIKQMVVKERMNPLGLPAERFLLAESEDGTLMGFGQLQEQPTQQDVQFLELRTLIVDPNARGEGVGTALLKQLMASPAASQKDVYLTTLAGTTAFYQKAGFAVVPAKEVPRQLWFEAFAGTIVARIVAQDRLVVMRHAARMPTKEAAPESSKRLL